MLGSLQSRSSQAGGILEQKYKDCTSTAVANPQKADDANLKEDSHEDTDDDKDDEVCGEAEVIREASPKTDDKTDHEQCSVSHRKEPEGLEIKSGDRELPVNLSRRDLEDLLNLACTS